MLLLAAMLAAADAETAKWRRRRLTNFGVELATKWSLFPQTLPRRCAVARSAAPQKSYSRLRISIVADIRGFAYIFRFSLAGEGFVGTFGYTD
jgi:hypothetical protein